MLRQVRTILPVAQRSGANPARILEANTTPSQAVTACADIATDYPQDAIRCELAEHFLLSVQGHLIDFLSVQAGDEAGTVDVLPLRGKRFWGGGGGGVVSMDHRGSFSVH